MRQDLVAQIYLSFPSCFSESIRTFLSENRLLCQNEFSRDGVSGCEVDSADYQSVFSKLWFWRDDVAFELSALNSKGHLLQSDSKELIGETWYNLGSIAVPRAHPITFGITFCPEEARQYAA